MRKAIRARLAVDRRTVRDDLGAGLVLTFVAIPAALGYAQVAGLPPAAGLSASVVGLVAYAVAGPTPVYVIGPDSSLAPMIGAALVPLAAAGSDRRLALGALLAVMVGGLLAIGGRLHLGLAADLLAKPIRIGFLNGIAAVIVIGQLPRALDLSTRHEDALRRLADLADDVRHGRGRPLALALAAGTIASWLLLRPKLQAAALPVALAGATIFAIAIGAPDRVDVVGRLHGALALPDVGALRWGDVATLAPAACGIALVAFADSVTLSRSLADRTAARVDENREMVALGVTNVAVGALRGFPVSASSSRTPAVLAAGARTRLCTITAAVVLAALVLVAPGATSHVPSAVLSAAVIVAALHLVDLRAPARLWRLSRADFAVSATTFVGVLLLEPLRGIGLAVGLAVVLFVARFWRPYRAELVRVDRRKGYHDVARHPEGRRIPGLVIARFDAPLFFANAAAFSTFITGLVQKAPQPVRRVILAAEPVTDVDATAADELASLIARLHAMGVSLDFAELKGPVKDTLARYGVLEKTRSFSTIGTAVRCYLRESGTPWVDWEERATGEGGPLDPAELRIERVESRQMDEEVPMRAAVGDRIVVRATHIGEPGRSAIVLAVEGPDGGPPYRVRWDDDEHVSLFVPGADAIVEHLPEVAPGQSS